MFLTAIGHSSEIPQQPLFPVFGSAFLEELFDAVFRGVDGDPKRRGGLLIVESVREKRDKFRLWHRAIDLRSAGGSCEVVNQQMYPVFRSRLFKQPLKMIFHGSDGDPQRRGDFAVTESLRKKKRQDLKLAG